MPEIQAAYEQYKDRGFAVLAVNFGEKPQEVLPFVKNMGLAFPVLIDHKIKVASQYGVVSLPVSFFIDIGGIIKEQVFGGTLTKEGIGKILQRFQPEKRS